MGKASAVYPSAVMAAPVYRSRPNAFDIRPASQPAARAVAEGVWLSEGLSNSYLVVTAEGRVVVNTGMGFEAPVHRRNYDAVDRGPIRYVILTQGHVDHVGGVDLFREAGTEVVAQAGNAAQQADDARIARFRARRSAFAWSDAIARANRHIRENLGGAVAPQSRPEPTLVFEDRTAFELGGVRFELLATPGGETSDSLVVWLPGRGTCFTGNLFSALFGHFPNLVTIRGDRYRDALRFVDSLERVRALEPERLLVGHGPPVEGRERIQAELARLRDAVRHVHDATVAGMNAGRDVYALMREIRLPPELEVGEGYGKVAWGVRAIFEGYAGWFQARSTTELYGVPPSCVWGELAELAGGPGPLAERARRRLAAGEAVAALHLAEVALAAEPEHRGALEASLAAHRALLEGSENFWEVHWLRREIERLERALAPAPAARAGA
jgi:glyoxylase-like metal-dependent hydrolase (beta-lactamase superfamily II)